MHDYKLPIQIIDPRSVTPMDEELITAMAEVPPATKLKPGDLVYLDPGEVPPYLRVTKDRVPRVWQVRFIISAWAHELMRLVHDPSKTGILGVDHAIALLDEEGFRQSKRTKPVIYAHGFPHGLYPDSASWFPERVLRKVVLRDHNQDWATILDEAKAPFVGYDTSGLVAPFTFDLAPDLYSNGENLGRPFSFEEATTHTAALLGMEEIMFCPALPYNGGRVKARGNKISRDARSLELVLRDQLEYDWLSPVPPPTIIED